LRYPNSLSSSLHTLLTSSGWRANPRVAVSAACASASSQFPSRSARRVNSNRPSVGFPDLCVRAQALKNAYSCLDWSALTPSCGIVSYKRA
jgi:hypothetical protein